MPMRAQRCTAGDEVSSHSRMHEWHTAIQHGSAMSKTSSIA
jgi:hypothetical protein